MTETVIKGSIRLIKHIDAELENLENAPTPQAEAEIPAATDPSAPEAPHILLARTPHRRMRRELQLPMMQRTQPNRQRKKHKCPIKPTRKRRPSLSQKQPIR